MHRVVRKDVSAMQLSSIHAGTRVKIFVGLAHHAGTDGAWHSGLSMKLARDMAEREMNEFLGVNPMSAWLRYDSAHVD